MKKNWMIRAGEGAVYLEQFLKENRVAIDFGVGDLSETTTREDILKLYKEVYPDAGDAVCRTKGGQLYRFRAEIATGDNIVTYSPSNRLYHVGEVKSEYLYETHLFEGHPHRRIVEWTEEVPRDKLSLSTRNSLGAILTLFLLNEDITEELEQIIANKTGLKAPLPSFVESDDDEQVEEVRQRTIEQANEALKDSIVQLNPNDMEELVAHLLRAMGYRSKVSPIGPDRGVDVTASPDGLGFTQPRIKAEVKHQPNSSKGSQDLRSFIGALRDGDCGLYISTGGFTREAKYEAERANHPVTLIDLETLASLITEHYENFDAEGRNLLPLDRIYWPRD
ncbi:MAG: restriction endonuclease [Opitutae bacterium]|jgi:restriction system protein|nr:restriction endonuclease [Opitutae bacterium]MBT7924064.1 restriction endonuclease [Opitutae bacterium]